MFFMGMADTFVNAKDNVRTDPRPNDLHPTAAEYREWLDVAKPPLDELMK